MTIGIYDGHTFLIKHIKNLARLYACADCQARFTQACHLQRHSQTCAQGKTVIDCPNRRVEAPQTVYERVFYGKPRASTSSVRWLEGASKQLGRQIHHALCGHGGERWIEGAPVDGRPKNKDGVLIPRLPLARLLPAVVQTPVKRLPITAKREKTASSPRQQGPTP